MIYIVRINDKEYEVAVEKGTATINNTVAIASQPAAPVATAAQAPIVQAAAPVASATQPPQTAKASGEEVYAPMPGVILDIKLKVGDRVKKDDVLFILEAMKMENEITATSEGVISQIVVSKGADVNSGDLLLIMS